MSEQIIDGTGSGKKAMVDKDNRLHTHAVSETIVENSSKNGDSYNINTGTINLTSATKSAVLYFKNNGNFDLHIANIGYLLGNSTDGTGDIILGVDKKGVEFYQLTLGGSAENDAAIGDRLGPAIEKEKVADTIAALVEVYIKHRTEDERFLDTYRRIGMQPFKERVYGEKRNTRTEGVRAVASH